MRLLILVFSILVCGATFSQTKIGGVIMPNVMKVGDEYLKLNGGGIREKMFIDLYIGALYLREKSSSASAIINADEPMAVKMRVVSGMVSKENMEEAIRTGFENSTGGKTAPIQDKIDKLITVGFEHQIVVGDIIDLVYEPGKGISLHKNNTSIVTIPGLDFKKALFGIWLCDVPADENLKNKMLGL
jgi:hypothetical protein